MTVDELLTSISGWAARHDEIVGVALVGSHARSEAASDSDVDLIVLTGDLHRQLGDRSWLAEFGEVLSVALEQWGIVASLRVQYQDGPEVEFGIAPARWAWTDPVDRGTREVVRRGMRILYDPNEVLGALADAVGSQ
ncbi:MAG: aminoglycoside 6-adenylyltransferase [Acidimicrobiia bacterium]